MFWTHIFDFLGKAIATGVAVVVMVLPYWLWNDRQIGLSSIIKGMAAAGAAWWWILRPLSSWLYARVHLGTRLTWAQARQAGVLFSPIRSMVSWYPMKECRSLPAEERPAAIMTKTEVIRDYYRARAAELQSAPLYAKIVRVMLWLAVAGCAGATLANVPPFSQLNEFQARLFDGSYYPLLSVIVAMLPAGIALRLWDKKHGVRSVEPTQYVPPTPIHAPGPFEVPAPPAAPPAEPVERDWRPPAERVRKDGQPPT